MRSTASSSSASHARPQLTYTAWTTPCCASAAASTALSKPAEKRRAVGAIGILVLSTKDYECATIHSYVLRYQADRVLLRPSADELRRHLPSSARPQRRRRDRHPLRHARPSQYGDGLLRHQAHRQGLDRPRAGSQDDPADRRSARRRPPHDGGARSEER